MSYLDRLKKSGGAGGGTLQNHQNLETGGFVGFEGTAPGPFQKIEGAEAANDPPPKAQIGRRDDAFSIWLIRCPHRLPFEVYLSPPGTLAEVLQTYTTAIRAEPVQRQEPPRACRTCRHLKRPGLANGYCGERDDLPPAYGPGHPLRRLPDDGGACCDQYENSGACAGVTASSTTYPASREPDKT